MDHSTTHTPPPPVFVFAIADRSDNGTEGYTFTVTFQDPADMPQGRWLHDRLSAILHTAVSPAIEVTDDNRWRFFLPDSIIAPEACYAHSPSDQLRRDLTDAFVTLFAGRQQRTRRSQPKPTVQLDDSVTEVTDIYGPRRSRRLAAKARKGPPGNDQKDDTNSKKSRKNQSRRR